MTEKQPLAEVQRQAFIEDIKVRSAKPNSLLRREAFANNPAELERVLTYYSLRPQSGIKTIEDILGFYAEEDAQKDAHMVTSNDILDLYASFKQDSRTVNVLGAQSLKTVDLLNKVTQGFAWATEANVRFDIKRERLINKSETDEELKEHLLTFETYGIPTMVEKLEETKYYAHKFKSIDEILNSVDFYAEGAFAHGAQYLVRDLDANLVGYHYAGQFMDFLKISL